jgi:hypothetical protein
MKQSENAIPIIKLQKTDVTLAELVTRFRGQAVGFQIPRLEGMLILLPGEDFGFVTSAIQARKALPTRPSRTPAEHFAETVHVLRRLEQKHGMASAEFYRKFQEGALQEGPVDYWEWRVRYKSFLTMKERFGFSETEVVNA